MTSRASAPPPPRAFRARQLWLTVVMALACSADGDPLAREYPTLRDPQCRPEPGTGRVHIDSSSVGFGASLDRVIVRRSAVDTPTRLVAVGAPGSNRARIYPHQAPTWSTLATLSASSGTGLFQLGHATAAADLLEMSEFDPSTWQRAGHELLIGAPGEATPQTAQGWLTLWSARLPKEGAGPNVSWHFEGQWRPDGSGGTTAASSTANFGAGLAVATHDPFSTVSHPPFIVVGGPGDRRAWVFEVDPTAGSLGGALTQVSTFQSTGFPTDFNKFGADLVLADLNQDGFLDLVVPNPTLKGPTASPWSGGAVHVIPGTTPGAGYFDWASSLLIEPSWPAAARSEGDDFGASVAVGHYTGGPGTPRGLAIGAPGLDLTGLPDAGGVCVQNFVSAGADGTPKALTLDGAITCYENPYSALGLTAMGWGTSVLALNAAPRDSLGDESFDEGLAQDLVVGCPGCRGFTVDGGGVMALDATTPVGRLFVYGSTVDGPWIATPTSPANEDVNEDWPIHQVEAPAGFSDYASRLFWLDAEDNGALDIVAVAEGARRLHVTEQEGDDDLGDVRFGEFAAVGDAVGDPFRLRFSRSVEDDEFSAELLDRILFRLEEPGDPNPVACTVGARFTGQSFVPQLVDGPLPVPFAEAQPMPAIDGLSQEIELFVDDAVMRGNLSFSTNGTPADFSDDTYSFEYLGVWEFGVPWMPPPCAIVIDGVRNPTVVFTRTSSALADACLP